jgi:serine/threonine protein kinase
MVGLIGAGGMGEVYRARDPRLGRDVAVKVLPAAFSHDPERMRRFEQEARATAALDHPVDEVKKAGPRMRTGLSSDF